MMEDPRIFFEDLARAAAQQNYPQTAVTSEQVDYAFSLVRMVRERADDISRAYDYEGSYRGESRSALITSMPEILAELRNLEHDLDVLGTRTKEYKRRLSLALVHLSFEMDDYYNAIDQGELRMAKDALSPSEVHRFLFPSE